MRWVHMAIVATMLIAMVIFAVQNLQTISLDFLSFSLRAPIAVIMTGVYVLGAITGSSLFALIRRAVKGASATGAPA